MSKGKADYEGAGIFFIPLFGLIPLGYLLSLILWLAGQMSGVVAGNGWPDSSPVDAPSILKRWVQDPVHPAAAWPGVTGAALGSAAVMIVVALLCLIPIGILIYLLVRGFMDLRRHRPVRLFRLGFASRYEIPAS